MKKNMGNMDKLIRLIAALVIVILYYTEVISGTLAIVLFVIAAVFAVTSFINFCPLYSLFGFSTKKKD
jgi:hypothetical protein